MLALCVESPVGKFYPEIFCLWRYLSIKKEKHFSIEQASNNYIW